MSPGEGRPVDSPAAFKNPNSYRWVPRVVLYMDDRYRVAAEVREVLYGPQEGVVLATKPLLHSASSVDGLRTIEESNIPLLLEAFRRPVVDLTRAPNTPTLT